MSARGLALDLHSDNGQGPRPIHWASRNGHVAVVDELLGVRINIHSLREPKFGTLKKFFLYSPEWRSGGRGRP